MAGQRFAGSPKGRAFFIPNPRSYTKQSEDFVQVRQPTAKAVMYARLTLIFLHLYIRISCAPIDRLQTIHCWLLRTLLNRYTHIPPRNERGRHLERCHSRWGAVRHPNVQPIGVGRPRPADLVQHVGRVPIHRNFHR